MHKYTYAIIQKHKYTYSHMFSFMYIILIYFPLGTTIDSYKSLSTEQEFNIKMCYNYPINTQFIINL